MESEEIMLPVSNGSAIAVVADINFLNEQDSMAEFSDLDQLGSKDNHPDPFAVPSDAVVNENEEEQNGAEAEADALERKPTQVPKKRKDATLMAETESLNSATTDEKLEAKHATEDTAAKPAEELPTSSRAQAARENTVDEDQCRVCTTKEDLVSLFKIMDDKKKTIADWLMVICPTVSIAIKDFMPQYICNSCLDNVTIAIQLKAQCENTEKELRKKLSRSKNKIRRPMGYVVIDAPLDSDPPTDEEELKSDAEFKVSDVEIASSVDDEDSEDSDYDALSSSKKKRSSGAGRGRGRRKSGPASAAIPMSKGKKGMVRSQKRSMDNSSDDDENPLRTTPPSQKKKIKKSGSNGQSDNEPSIYPCDDCDQTFTRKLSLILHKKGHEGGREIINCEICGKQFKIKGAYRTHLEKHKDDGETAAGVSSSHNCTKCDKVFPNKADLRRHLADSHNEQMTLYQCKKCSRSFVSETRLIRHKEGRCPGLVKNRTKEFEGYAAGKDLFKTVAPLTTTYWSDSFSD